MLGVAALRRLANAHRLQSRAVDHPKNVQVAIAPVSGLLGYRSPCTDDLIRRRKNTPQMVIVIRPDWIINFPEFANVRSAISEQVSDDDLAPAVAFTKTSQLADSGVIHLCVGSGWIDHDDGRVEGMW